MRTLKFLIMIGLLSLMIPLSVQAQGVESRFETERSFCSEQGFQTLEVELIYRATLSMQAQHNRQSCSCHSRTTLAKSTHTQHGLRHRKQRRTQKKYRNLLSSDSPTIKAKVHLKHDFG